MLIVTDKITGEEVTFPAEWSEVTYSQFMALTALGDKAKEADVLFILASDSELLKTFREPGLEDEVLPKLTFLTDQSQLLELPVPESVNVGGKVYVIGQDLGLFSYGHKMAIDSLLADLADTGQPVTPLTAAKELLGVYLDQQRLDSMERIQRLMKEVEQMAVTDVIPVAAFFLHNYRTLTSSGGVSLRSLTKTPPKKWRTWLFRKLARFRSSPAFRP